MSYLAKRLIPITPNDGADLPEGPCAGLLVGTGGAATVIDGSGTERTGVPLQEGYNPISVKRVKASGLAAANLWALY